MLTAMDTLDDETGVPGSGVSDDPQWEQLWRRIDTIPGWLTRAQAAVLHHAARELGPGATILEIGAHRGRSTTALAAARDDVTVVTIDPFITTRLLPGPSVAQELGRTLARFEVADRVTVIQATSRAARSRWADLVDLLWIDGKHDVWTVTDDLRWVAFVRSGGPVYVHDAYSSVGVTLALIANQVSPGSTLRYVGRTGSLAHFVKAPPTRTSRQAFVISLPWWARNIAIKALLRLRLRRTAHRVFGHTDRFDPY